ncbi:MAG: carbon-nitrogen hydrolase family protein [Acidobacteriota bacterium]
MTLAAVVQMTSTSDEAGNWESARTLIELAASRGAELVATPENTNYLGPHLEKVRLAEPLGGKTCSAFASLAARLRIHLLLGSFNETGPDAEHCYNTSVLFSPAGSTLAVYRKIHLFDIDHSEAARFRESDTCAPGREAVVAATKFARLGMSICYDVRFGELYRKLVDGGAEVILVPSAFTMTTGKDHWQVLLRARAIETQCYVLAPAQCGKHDDRGLGESYGHAMIVDPWGDVVAMASEGPGLAIGELDLDRVRRVRSAMPLASHRRLGEAARE